MAYSSQAQIEAILGRTLTASEVTSLVGLQAIVDGWITVQLGGEAFSSGVTTRYYDSGATITSIGPVRNITAVNLVSTDSSPVTIYSYTDGTDYVTGPYNSDTKTYIEKRYWNDWNWSWDDDTDYWHGGPKRLAVTGTFGYGNSTTDAIAYLASYLVGRLLDDMSISTSISASGNKKSESIEGYSVTWDTVSSSSQSLLDDLLTNDPIVQMALAGYTGGEVFF